MEENNPEQLFYTKTCNKCFKEKTNTEFHLTKNVCKSCLNASRIDFYNRQKNIKNGILTADQVKEESTRKRKIHNHIRRAIKNIKILNSLDSLSLENMNNIIILITDNPIVH